MSLDTAAVIEGNGNDDLSIDLGFSDINADSGRVTSEATAAVQDNVAVLLQSAQRVPLGRLQLGMDRIFEDVDFEFDKTAADVVRELGSDDLKTALIEMVTVAELRVPAFFKAIVTKVVAFLFTPLATRFATGVEARSLTPAEAQAKLTQVLRVTFQTKGSWLQAFAKKNNLWEQRV